VGRALFSWHTQMIFVRIRAAALKRCFTALGLLCWVSSSSLAQVAGTAQGGKPASADASLQHPWLFPPPSPSPEAYITNLPNGATVESPFVLRFGLSLRGLVPAGHSAGKAGHHHLLINQELPLQYTTPLPFSDKYIHFGKGQMETLVNVAPGDYTFRMVLADQAHVPYFVYSKPLTVHVTRQHKGVAPADVLGPPRVEMMGLADGDTLKPPLRIQFHASGYNIAHQAAQVPDTHYFRLVLDRAGERPEVLDFKSGQTEAWFNPPRGLYTARLDLVRNQPNPGTVVARSPTVNFTVSP
jgi:hypothetical protein